eukprot:PhM_4_TR8147/c0_g1_i1/m.99768
MTVPKSTFTSIALLTILASAMCINAQDLTFTTQCSSSYKLTPGTRTYFQADLANADGFEYRIISRDGKAVGYKELYYMDPWEEVYFDCFPETSVDDSTCLTSYISNGISNPPGVPMDAQKIMFGFEPCTGTNYSSNVEVQLFYNGSTTGLAVATCSGFTMLTAVPAYCASAATALTYALGALLAVAMTLM